MEKKRILSCIQPTGDMHLGNYFGAIQNWILLQENYNCIYGIVDYHAMTMPYNPNVLRQNTMSLAIDLIACGILPENLFIQSLIPEHTELAWILSCVTSYGELTRQTQFKEKSQQIADNLKTGFVSGGLFTYPVLQAADILIYNADLVPVGKDQEQHLELSRNIAERFNYQFHCEYFVIPQCLFSEIPKVMSLADPTKKMSKSLGEKHYISLFEDESSIRQKVKTAVTDAGSNPNEMSAGVINLFELLKVSGSHKEYDELYQDFENGTLKYIDLKNVVADSLINLTKEFQVNRNTLLANQDLVEKRIHDSSYEIRERARKTVREVKEIVGLN